MIVMLIYSWLGAFGAASWPLSEEVAQCYGHLQRPFPSAQCPPLLQCYHWQRCPELTYCYRLLFLLERWFLLNGLCQDLASNAVLLD